MEAVSDIRDGAWPLEEFSESDAACFAQVAIHIRRELVKARLGDSSHNNPISTPENIKGGGRNSS